MSARDTHAVAVAAARVYAVTEVKRATHREPCACPDGCDIEPYLVELEVEGTVTWDPVAQEWHVADVKVLSEDGADGGELRGHIEEGAAENALIFAAERTHEVGRCVTGCRDVDGRRMEADGADWKCDRCRRPLVCDCTPQKKCADCRADEAKDARMEARNG